MSEDNQTMCEPLTYKQLMVKALLLTEIIAFRRTTKCPDLETRKDNNSQTTEDSLSECDSSTEIFMHNGIIYSSQHYNSGPDPDMSDIAVAFYKILYRKDILNDYNDIKDKFFAGDTMNSYNRVAKNASPEMKQEWYFRYHCLANFWLIPFSIGRRGPKWSKHDSLDIFLVSVRDNDPKKKRTNHKYFDTFRKEIDSTINYDKFLSFHYLNNYETVKQKIDEITKKYTNNPDEVIKKMIECIELRADNIVRDSKTDEEGKTVCDRLYDFFKENNLL